MPFSENLLTPIPGDKPGGTDIRYDKVRDEIKEARREEVDAPQGVWKSEVKTANWNKVIQLATKVLTERSKDLQIGVWLADAHVRKEGFTAITPGLRFLNGLVGDFWDTMYPEIEDGDLEERESILSWLGTRLGEDVRILPILRNGYSHARYKESRIVGDGEGLSSEDESRRNSMIAEGKISVQDWDAAVDETPKVDCEALQAIISSALETVETLNQTCEEKFGNYAPSFMPARQALEDVAGLARAFISRKGGPSQGSEPDAEEDTAPTPPTGDDWQPAPAEEVQQTPRSAPARRGSSSIASEPVSLEDAGSRIAAVCRFLRKNDENDPSPYLILRGFRFGQARKDGADALNEERLPEPPPGLRAELRRLYNQQDWDALVEASERAMELPCARGWLDLQFYSARSLEEKGYSFEPILEAISSETRGYLRDRPGLLEMCLADGTPTAGPDSRKWIEEKLLPRTEQTSEPAAEGEPEPERQSVVVDEIESPTLLEPGEVQQSTDPIFEEAAQQARRGRIGEAVATLSRQLDLERSGRKRFVRRVQIAHLLVQAGQNRVAHPILQELATEIETRSLEAWEDSSGLAYPLTLLLQCLNGEASESDRAKLYARICRLDPMRALNLGGSR